MDTTQFEATQPGRNNKVHDQRYVQIKRIDEISLTQTPCQAFLYLPRLPYLSLSH